MSILPPAFANILQQYLPAVAGWLLTYAVHSTLLLLAVWLLTLIVPPRRQQLKDVLWKTALAGGLLTATFQLLSGMEPVSGRHILAFRSDADPQGILQQITSRPDVSHELTALLDSCQMDTPSTSTLISANPDSRKLTADHCQQIFSESISGAHDLSPEKYIRTRRQSAADSGEVHLEITASLQAAGDSIWQSELPPHVFKLPPEAKIHDGTRAAEAESYSVDWMVWLLIAWVAGVLIAAIRYFRARGQLRRLLADRRILRDHPVLTIFQQLCRSAACTHPPHLTVSPHITSPMALSRREICLPQRALSELDPREQQTMLAHELAHILRRDHRWLHFCALLDIFFFFQPLNRLARHQLQESAEYLCDDWAVQHTGQSLNLAKCLTRVAEWVQMTPAQRYVAAMGASGSALRRRVTRILEAAPAHEPHWRKRWPLLIATTLLLLTGWAAPLVSADYLRENIFVFYMGDYTQVRENEGGVSDQRRIFIKSLMPQDSRLQSPVIQMRVDTSKKTKTESDFATETQRSQRN